MTKTTTAAKAETAAPVEETATANLPATVDASASTEIESPLNLTDNPWDGIGDGDLAPADDQLLPLLEMNRKIGEGVVDPTTGELTDRLEFVWMARAVTRAWWEKSFDDGGGQAPDCRSNDGMTGMGAHGPGSADNPTGKCATCPMSKWDGDKPPACKQAIEAMVAVLDEKDHGVNLYRLRFSGLAFAPARAFWDSFRARLPRIPAIGFLSEMKLEPVEVTGRGKFLVPRFVRSQALGSPSTNPSLAALVVERDRLIDEFKRLVAEDLATGATVADADEHGGRGPFDGDPNNRPYTDDPAEAAAVSKVNAAFGNEGVDRSDEAF